MEARVSSKLSRGGVKKPEQQEMTEKDVVAI